MSSDSKRQVAVEFSYAEPLVCHALTKQDFANAGKLLEYLDCHEDELKKLRVKRFNQRLRVLLKGRERESNTSLCLSLSIDLILTCADRTNRGDGGNGEHLSLLCYYVEIKGF